MKHPRALPALRDIDGMAVLGRTLFDLRGIRFEEGEGGNGGDSTPPAEPTPPAAPAAPPAAPSQPAAPAAPAQPAAPINYRGDPDAYVRELREESRTHRLAAEDATNKLTTASTERDTFRTENEQLARENHLLRVAPKYGADADRLLDSSSFMKSFAEVDVTKDDDVKKAIEDALERNSAFRAGPALPPRSGGGHQGGNPTTTPTLEGAVAAALRG